MHLLCQLPSIVRTLRDPFMLLLVATLSTPVTAQRDPWRLATLDGIEIISTASPRATQNLVRELLHFREAVGRVRPDLARAPRPDLRIIIVNRLHQFSDIVPSAQRDFAQYVGLHLTRPFYDTIVVDLGAIQDSRPLVQHELTHHLMAHLDVRTPTWLDEGMAETFAGARPDGRQFTFGHMYLGASHYVLEHGPLPLRLFFQVQPGTLRESQVIQYYGTAMGLTHAGTFGRDIAFRRAFSAFANEACDRTPDEAMVRRHFGMSFLELEQFIVNHIREGQYHFVQFPRAELEDPPQLALRPLSAADRAGLFAPFAVHFDEEHARTLIAVEPGGTDDFRLAMARVDLVLMRGGVPDPGDIAILDAARALPDSPAYVHLASAIARFNRAEKPLPKEEMEDIIQAIEAYSGRRGFTRDARRLYVSAWAAGSAIAPPEARQTLASLARRYYRDPLVLRASLVALTRARAMEEVDALLAAVPEGWRPTRDDSPD